MERSTHSTRVTLYSAPTCPYCSVARRYLVESGVEFTEIDISLDRAARREMVLMTAQRGVPVLLVDGKTLVGWNEAEFERMRCR